MRFMAAGLLLAALTLTGCAAGPAQPYAGMESRAIKAMAPERVADLLEGRGAGYALAAELNGYPGPTHVLELMAKLNLTPEQERQTEALFGQMQQEAKRFGRMLVDLEEQLEAGFASGSITRAELERLTGGIAATEGRLRAVHLAAHLAMKEILTPEQAAHYDRLRGYDRRGGHGHKGH